MHVFVTGATGFVGSHLVGRLESTRHDLTCLVRDPARAAAIAGPGVRLVQGDVTDPAAVRLAMRGCDAVVHLAGLCSYWERDASRYEAVNFTGTRVVMEAALEAGVRRVVHLSTALTFGRPADDVFDEDSEPGEVTFSEFARTKRAADRLVWTLHRELGLPVVVLLAGGILGHGDHGPMGELIADVAQGRVSAVPFADSRLTFVHVRDVAEAIVRALQTPGVSGRAYLLGGETARLGDVVAMASDAAGREPPRRRVSRPVAAVSARVADVMASITGHHSRHGLTADQVETLAAELRFDGSRAERELGIRYTPLADAVRDEVVAALGGERAPVAAGGALPRADEREVVLPPPA